MPPVSFKTFVQGSTAASTPLGGTEQIVIIQGNAVVQCVADDLGTTVVNKTVAEMQALALASGFTAGQLYKITDAGDLGLFFRAATTSKLENDGIRVMLCPAYYGTGEHNSDGNNWLGAWLSVLAADPTITIGDLTIWGGKVWRNTSNNIGGSAANDTTLDTVHWTLVEKTDFSASEYTPMIFGCSYDLTNNWISRQWDGKGNIFGGDYYTVTDSYGFNPVDISDWNLASGNNGYGFYGNRCLGVWNNRVNQIYDNSNAGPIYGNSNAGPIYGNSNAGPIYDNSNAGEVSLNVHSGYISGCTNGDYISGCYGKGNLDNISIPGPIAGELPKNIYTRDSDFTANGISGATYTDTGSSVQVNVAFFDAPIGWEYSFFVTDNAIQLEPHTIGHTIQFWDGGNSRNTGWVLLGAPGKSITIKKISATVWAGIAVNGATDND